MRKELPVQLPAERALSVREKELFSAGCGCLPWSDTQYVDAWESKGPLFRIHAFEELDPEIDVMAGEIQRLSGSRMASAEEARALGTFLEHLRSVAKVVEHSAVYRESTSPELCGWNRELETMVCILRNNLDQIAMRSCA